MEQEQQCYDCKTPKPLTQFSRDSREKFGRRFQCKACARNYEKTQRREKRIAYSKSKNGRSVAKQATKKYLTKPDSVLKIAARAALNNAVKCGLVVRAVVCSCGNSHETLHGHHHKGYEKEHWLDVEWLCRDCHAAVT